jgi:Plasmid pRiA4b ORF-3-like protein
MAIKLVKKRRGTAAARQPDALQFLVVLLGTDPLIWRRILMVGDASFWDLHVAIQDAMGWQDTHLHEFKVVHPNGGEPNRIGIPDPEGFDERPSTPSWEVTLSAYFGWEALSESASADYLYDFGDSWRHVVALEAVLPRGTTKSPRCLAGARACPPEDCGGLNGFAEFLEAIADAGHPEHAELLRWVGGSYAPEAFDPTGVKFSDPKRRWKRAFGPAPD